MEDNKEFKLDTSFDLLKTDGIKLATDIKKEEDEISSSQKSLVTVSKVKDMKSIFATANDSVKKATEIFNKNIELKKKLEEKVELLNKEKKELETKRQEFKNHKDALSKQVEILKQKQTEFEMYKITETKKFDLKVKELEEKELDLKTQRETLEIERENIELDRAKCENEKEELANNLNKFNELVSEFSVGMDKFNNIGGTGI